MSAADLPANKHQERSLRTRELLLDATIDSLAEVGYARTSSAEVCARVGLSRGAQLHQFHTKSELMAHAVDHLAAKQIDALMAAEAAHTGTNDVAGAIVDVMMATFSGRLGRAAAQLFIACGDDPGLLDGMLRTQRSLTSRTVAACERIAGDVDHHRFETIFSLTVNLIRGFNLEDMLHEAPGRRVLLLEAWKWLAEVALTDGRSVLPD